MRFPLLLALLLWALVPASLCSQGPAAARPPSALPQTYFRELPLGTIKPRGWLRDQLQAQANGLTGHLEDFWPDLGKESAWKGGSGEGWERGPYYLDGLVPLAWLLEDAVLQGRARVWIEWMLSSAQPNGWFGPAKNTDRWPLAVALKVLSQYFEVTRDARTLQVIQGYFRYLKDSPPDWPDAEWRGVRAMENAVTGYWLHERTGDPAVLEVIRSITENSFSWKRWGLEFPYTAEVIARGVKPGHPTHGVNIAMAIKYPGLYHRQSRDNADRKASLEMIRNLDLHHGQATGAFGCDEHLSGSAPTQGTELCTVVEYMFSLEKLLPVLGDARLADRLEQLAYNALPGTCTPDLWAHQYDQQTNQVLCTPAKRRWSTNGNDSNLYGLEPNFGCCTANLHQGWPKLATHLWMATETGGLAAMVYAPCVVVARAGAGGGRATITEETEYPFDGKVTFTINVTRPTAFDLALRIPSWADGATLNLDGSERRVGPAGDFFIVTREWKDGEKVELNLPPRIRAEKRSRGAVAIWRGPLLFSLRIGERFEKIRGEEPHADYAVHPTTPWNYALALDPARPQNALVVDRRPITKFPFDNAGAPVILRARGRQVPGWTLVESSAGETPLSPVSSTEPEVALELIPYGCTRLRVTELPVLGPVPGE